MTTARERHAATRLADGRVLVAGGSITTSYGLPMTSSELYNPTTGTWTAAADLPIAVADAAAVTLPDGTVLVAGGAGTATQLYDPNTNTWASGPSLPAPTYGPTFATTLPNGLVFVMGTSAAAYNPATKTWQAVEAPPSHNTSNHGWTTLPNGDLATTSTMAYAGTLPPYPVTGPSVYHWATNTWTTTPVAPFNIGDRGIVAAGLPNGNVMVAGGIISYIWGANSVNAVMEVNPTTGAWTTDSDFRAGSELVQLPNGSILATGGSSTADVDLVYTQKTGTWAQVPGQAATSSTFTTLADGTILAAGGDAYDATYGSGQRIGAANQAAIFTP